MGSLTDLIDAYTATAALTVTQATPPNFGYLNAQIAEVISDFEDATAAATRRVHR